MKHASMPAGATLLSTYLAFCSIVCGTSHNNIACLLYSAEVIISQPSNIPN